MRRRDLGGLLLAAAMTLMAWTAQAQKVPSTQVQEILIRTTLLTLNDANLTGDYDVLHARVSKAFQNATSVEQLKTAFKPFADAKIRFWLVATQPITIEKAAVDEKGTLCLVGLIPTPDGVDITYDLRYIVENNIWEIYRIDVATKKK